MEGFTLRGGDLTWSSQHKLKKTQQPLTANARYSNHHTTRDDSQGYDRRIEWSTASIPRTREKLMRPSEIKNPSSVREIPPFKDSGRKRRYDDTLENHNHKPSSSKERAVTRRMNQNKSPAAASKSAGLSHVSDSQLTVSDPLISSYWGSSLGYIEAAGQGEELV